MDSVSAGQLYFELLQQGVSPKEAFDRAFPNGVQAGQSPQEAAKKAQGNALASTGGLVGGAIAGKYLASQVPGWLAGSGGAAEAAPVAIEAVTPLPQLAAPALSGGAGASSGAGAAAANSGFGVGGGGGGGATSAGSEMLANPALADAAGVAGVIAVPMVAKYLGDKFLPENINRPFVASEAAASPELERQIPGYGNLDQGSKEALVTRLHDLKMLAATGKGRYDEAGQLVSDDPSKSWTFSTAYGGRNGTANKNIYEQLAASLYGPGTITRQREDNPFYQRAVGTLSAIFGEDAVPEKMALLKAIGGNMEQYHSVGSNRH